MAYLYGVGIAYGAGTGIWLDSLAGVSDPGIGIIAMPLPRPVGGRWCAMGAAGTVEDLDRDEQAITAELREIVSGWQDSSDEKFAMAKIEGGPLNP